MNKQTNIQAIIFASISIMLLTVSKPSHAQTDLARSFIESSLSGQGNDEAGEAISQWEPMDAISAFNAFTTDSLAEVRFIAYKRVYRLSYRQTDDRVRQQAVLILSKGLNDEDAGILSRITAYLEDYPLGDFSPECKYILSQRIKSDPPYFRQMVKLSGYLQIEELLYNYKQMLEDKKLKQADRWAIQTAMARMGDEEALAEVMSQAKSFGMSDDVVFDILPNLAYVRQKASFDYLLEIIQSDRKDCLSANPSVEAPIICAYRVIEIAGPYIKDFPLPLDESGDVIIEDYDKDLATVREWIAKGKYELEEGRY